MLKIVRTRASKALMLALLAAVSAGLSAPARARAAAEGDWLPVTIVYTGDVNGKVEPCG